LKRNVPALLLSGALRINELEALGVSRGELEELEVEGLIRIEGEEVRVLRAVQLAIEAVKRGSDIEEASRWLSWRDFEKLCVEALMSHGFKVKAPLRFKAEGRRFEIDVVGVRGSLVLCIDCKHWSLRRGLASKVRDAAAKHLDRCLNLASVLSEALGLKVGAKPIIVPILVTLSDMGFKSTCSVLVVAIYKLNSLLLELEDNLDVVPSIRAGKLD